VSTPRV